jgi:NADH dehydrogenase
MSKASQDDTLKALTNLGVVVQLNKLLITSTTPYSYQLEKRFKPKFNLGCRVSAIVFEGIPAESYGRGRWLPMRSTR